MLLTFLQEYKPSGVDVQTRELSITGTLNEKQLEAAFELYKASLFVIDTNEMIG